MGKKRIYVAGLQKQSFIDYPGKVSCVIFLAGCNMRCHYCHNPHLFNARQNKMDFATVMAHITAHRQMLDAVVISGGEPTLDPNLPWLLRELRKTGLLIKLDTNGTKPLVVKKLVAKDLVDYVALDIKGTAAKYPAITGMKIDPVLTTAEFLRQQNLVDYMFRTTLSPKLNENDLIEMGESIIQNAKVWQLQQCRIMGALSAEKVRKMVDLTKKYAQYVVLRGL